MFKAKEASLKNVVSVLVVSLAVSAAFYLSRPQTRTSSIPIFMGEEVTVQQTGTAVKAAPLTAVAEKAVSSAPVAQPPVAAPLPIVPPTIIFKVLPAYPASALQKGLEGIALLSVYIGLGGLPEKVETKTSSGMVALDEAATKAVAQWRFSPASSAGAAIASWFEVPVRFAIR